MVTAYEAQRDFGMILALHRENTSEWSMRRYDNFIYAGILDYYRAEWVASPLKNPKTARVFAHFISATGPTLSTFERHPRNTSALFDESPSPSSQQGLWTYTLPMMALNHQGLLHAMLALSSLHIAKLQQASITPSFKHLRLFAEAASALSQPPEKTTPSYDFSGDSLVRILRGNDGGPPEVEQSSAGSKTTFSRDRLSSNGERSPGS